MSWYTLSMPTISDLEPIVSQIGEDISKFPGVTSVHVWGSFAKYRNKPSYAVKDLDIIVSTSFDPGDLLAIDNGEFSALHMHTDDLVFEGYNPKAVLFTKKFLSLGKYNIDHWASSKDGQLFHWGATADSQDEWLEIHEKAEERATEITGFSREKLFRSSAENRKEWRKIYDDVVEMYISEKNTGWYPSSHKMKDIVSETLKLI